MIRKLKICLRVVLVMVVFVMSIMPVQATLRKEAVVLNHEVEIQQDQVIYDKEYEIGSSTEFDELQDILVDANNNKYVSIKVKVVDQPAIMRQNVKMSFRKLKHVVIDTTDFEMILQAGITMKDDSTFDYVGEHGVRVAMVDEGLAAVKAYDSSSIRLLDVKGIQDNNQSEKVRIGVLANNQASVIIEKDISFVRTAMNLSKYTSDMKVVVKGNILKCKRGINTSESTAGEKANVLIYGDMSLDAFVVEARSSIDIEVRGEVKTNSEMLMDITEDDVEVYIKAKGLQNLNRHENVRVGGSNVTLVFDLETNDMQALIFDYTKESHVTFYGDVVGDKVGALIEIDGTGSFTYHGMLSNSKGKAIVSKDADVMLESGSILVGSGITQKDVINAKSVTNQGVIIAVDGKNKNPKTENSQEGIVMFGQDANTVVWKEQADGNMWITYNDVLLMKEKQTKIGEFDIGEGDTYEYHSIQDVQEAIKGQDYTDVVITVCSPNMAEKHPVAIGTYESTMYEGVYQNNIRIDTSKYKYELNSLLAVFDDFSFTYTGEHGVDLKYEGNDEVYIVQASSNAYVEVNHIDGQMVDNNQNHYVNGVLVDDEATVVVNGSITNCFVGGGTNKNGTLHVGGDVHALSVGISCENDDSDRMTTIYVSGDIVAGNTGVAASGNVNVKVDGIVYKKQKEGHAVLLGGINIDGNVSVGGIQREASNQENEEADIYVLDYTGDTEVFFEVTGVIKQPYSVFIDEGAKLYAKGQWIGQTTDSLVNVEGEFIIEGGIINASGVALSASDTSSIKIAKDGYLIGKGATQEDVIDCLDTQPLNEGTIIAWDGNTENFKHETSTGLTVFGEHAKTATWFIDEGQNIHLALDGQPILLVKEGELVIEQPSDKPKDPSVEKPTNPDEKPTNPNIENPSTPNTENPNNSNTNKQVNTSSTKETNTQVHSPDTGDVNDVLHFMNMLITTGAGILMILILKKKK
ncbi:hypothetical protein EDD63_10651 [Breznakia blatticola]|uniref:Uncharacterized protein n=1 Tax=Breznakia blatticola TaxID=1754012 RepID=A0A4R8A9P4_9FIRM|nr:hypothetical protein [Breznakia blatticola]TDW25110.1 hypothetical protein EDD63_10651 [Breznakia blatticola]